MDNPTNDNGARRSVKKCRYYNRGYCKYKKNVNTPTPKKFARNI